MTTAITTALEDSLVQIVGRPHVQLDIAARERAAFDGMRPGRAALSGVPRPPLPLAVVRPCTADEVAAVLVATVGAGVPVVPYGGGTGLMGGALTVRPGIVLDLRRMDRVVEVAAEDRTARAQAGVVIADLNAALAPHGLMCGHDPWTVPIATIGGVISTNGLGYLGGRYGSAGDQVLGLEVVLTDGTIVRTRPAERSSTGPQLRRLWIGAEGTLGVITEATLRVFPVPEVRRLHALAFPTFADGYAAICAMAAIGLRPALIDYGAPPDATEPARLMLGFEGFAEEAAAAEGRALAICHAHGMTDLGARAADVFWTSRHVEPGRLRRWRSAEQAEPPPGTPGSTIFEYMHIYLPQSQVLDFLRRATAIFARAGARVTEWGLWNQPELVSLVVTRTTDTPDDLAAVRAAHDETLMLAQDLGGSMEYVHGVGVRLAHLMAREHRAGLDVLRRIKHVLDPDELLNPGKLALELPRMGYRSDG
jgi:alkyldihydroxyacetonephosphate synthase